MPVSYLGYRQTSWIFLVLESTLKSSQNIFLPVVFIWCRSWLIHSHKILFSIESECSTNVIKNFSWCQWCVLFRSKTNKMAISIERLWPFWEYNQFSMLITGLLAMAFWLIDFFLLFYCFTRSWSSCMFLLGKQKKFWWIFFERKGVICRNSTIFAHYFRL